MTEQPCAPGLDLGGQASDVIAMQIIQSLLGGRWSWPPRTVTEKYPYPESGHVILGGRPVLNIISVTDGDMNSLMYQISNGYIVSLGNPCYKVPEDLPPVTYPYEYPFRGAVCLPSCVYVTYEYGSPAPAPIAAAVAALSKELDAAASGSEECHLPERVTTVSRQGLSWTVLDPQDFLNDGRTGLYAVDLALSLYGNAKRRSRVFTPGNPPALRT